MFYALSRVRLTDVTDGTSNTALSSELMRVEIHASREEGPVDPVMKTAPRKSYIPPRYNAHSILKADVTPGGENRYVFELTAKP
jgi:hypothetical protein